MELITTAWEFRDMHPLIGFVVYGTCLVPVMALLMKWAQIREDRAFNARCDAAMKAGK